MCTGSNARRPHRQKGRCEPKQHNTYGLILLRSMQIGIVGLPNVGKSTLFNTLTKMGIPAENFPFCTIDPNNVSN